MATCAICLNEATHTYQPGPSFSIDYCQYHLPKFLIRSENPPIFPVVKEEPKPEPKVSKKKETEAAAEVSAE